MTTTKIKSLMPFVHALVLPLVISILFTNPLIGAIYLALPAVVYSTVKKEKEMNFFLPAIIMLSILISGWSDAVPMP